MLDTEIDALYESGARQVLQQIGRYKIPEFIELLDDSNFLTVSSFYNDRSDWDIIQKSQLIESLLLNNPIPLITITLWELEFNAYELLDGRRRIDALREFHNDRLKLKGLKTLVNLNGCTYRELPEPLKVKLDRHNLNTIALIANSISPEDSLQIKRLTFDRLHQND